MRPAFERGYGEDASSHYAGWLETYSLDAYYNSLKHSREECQEFLHRLTLIMSERNYYDVYVDTAVSKAFSGA